ncbi:MAG: hypothetical protein JWP00_4369 [Chloroflexi bacterium]|nr:hypothetical protein [Chloroflexota bacterium]
MQYSSSLLKRGVRLKISPVFTCFLFGLLLSIGIFAGTPSTALSDQPKANPNVKMTAHSLFNGNFKFGDWLPVEVSLENFGEEVQVEVQANIATRVNAVTYNTTYQRDVTLSERANKRLLLYIVPFVETSNSSGQVVYDTPIILKAGNQKLAEAKVNLQPRIPTDYLVGTFTQDPNGLNNLNNLKVGGGQRNRVTSLNLSLNDIPDRGSGLHSFNALIFSDQNTDSLSAEQRTALRDYVEGGGQIILAGGSGWSKVQSGFNPAFLPLDVHNYVNIASLDSLIPPGGEEIKASGPLSRPAVIAQGQVMKDARLLSHILNGNIVVPIAAERKVGAGRVVAMSVDLAVPPLTDWNGSTQFWLELFSFNVTPPHQLYTETNPQIKNASDMLNLVTNVPELKLPDISTFFILLAIYMVLMGPVNYLVLKKVKRLALSWITLPALTALFTFMVLNYANSQPPGQVLINQLSVIQVGADQDLAQLRSYSAVFSPEERNYDINPVVANLSNQSRILISPLNRSNSSLSDADAVRLMVQGDRPYLDNFEIGQWNAQGFALETSIQAQPYQISADLHYEDGKIVGTIHNNTALSLKNTMLTLGDAPVKFKDVIEAGEIVPVDFTLPSPTAASQAFCSTSFSSSSSFNSATPSERIANLFQQDRKDDKVIQVRANFLRKIYDSGRYSPVNTLRGLDLIAWMDQNPAPISVNGITSQSKSSQVLLARLPVNFETSGGDGRLLLPSMAFFPESVTSSNGVAAQSTRTDRTDQICVIKNSVTTQFRLPLESGPFKVKKLTLYINSFTSGGGGQRGVVAPESVEMYDFQAQSWAVLPNITNSAVQVNTGSNFTNPPPPVKNVIDNASRYADPVTGRILLRISSNTTAPLFVQQGLEVEGSRT